jgi:hypothetical protein
MNAAHPGRAGGFWRALFARRDPLNPVSSPAFKLGFAAAVLAVLYLLGAAAGFLWLNTVMKNDQIGFLDVALFRWQEVRRGVADKHFAAARRAWQDRNYEAAYLSFTSGLRSDPANLPGRLAAAEFLLAVRAGDLAAGVLESGLAANPNHPQLLDRTLEVLTTTARDARVLELLRRRDPAGASDPMRPVLAMHELRALLNTGAAAEARRKLDAYPELERFPRARPVVARVRWETRDRAGALRTMATHLREPESAYPAFAEMVQWQIGAGQPDLALETALAARAKFPDELPARLLHLEALAAKTARGPEWAEAVRLFLGEFGNRPDSLVALAALAGRLGWLDLARGLYEIAAARFPDLGAFAFAYADALMRNGRFRESDQLLAQIEVQSADASGDFLAKLRQRQVLASAAVGDDSRVREFSRRIAAGSRNDAALIENARRIFHKAGIAAAVEELSGGAAAAKTGR